MRYLLTQRLDASQVEEAAAVLKRGGLLGIPTETVYGLGADGQNPEAVRHIFEAKGRPQDNPLILHIPDAAWLDRYCKEIPSVAEELTRRFWPGPLTLLLPKKSVVPDVVTAGRPTVGMRCPACDVTREILYRADLPVAAPSGNRSGKPSPTSASAMLEDMDGRIDAILDAGPCAVGVESTILDLTVTPPRLLRPGGVTLEDLQTILGPIAVDPAVYRPMAPGEAPKAPGMKYRHYAPKAPVTVVQGFPDATASFVATHIGQQSGVLCFDEYMTMFPGHVVKTMGSSGDCVEQARRIFDALRSFDHTDVPDIWAQSPVDTGLGLAVVNRLNKAAGFHILSVQENTGK